MRSAFQFLSILSVVWCMVCRCGGATEIPFTFKSGMIWLEVRATGRAAPLHFLLDSGAGQSVIHLRTAQGLGLKLGVGETVQGVEGRCVGYRVESFAATVASVPVPRTPLALDLSSISLACGARIDGLLGADFFRDRIVQIDFAAQRVGLLSRDELRGFRAQTLPLASRNDAFCVRVAVNGNAPEWMRLDTGCSSALEWVAAGPNRQPASRTSVGASTGATEQIQTEVLLGSERVPAVKTGMHRQPIFSGEAGLLGNGLLSRFCVTVDAGQSQLLLQRVK